LPEPGAHERQPGKVFSGFPWDARPQMSTAVIDSNR
jgi:hypothetical protein